MKTIKTLFFLTMLTSAACRKQDTIASNNTICKVDSIIVYRYDNAGYKENITFKIKYENEMPSIIREYRESFGFISAQRLYFDGNKKLITKEYINPFTGKIFKKRKISYNASGLLSTITDSLQNFTDPLLALYKNFELQINYNDRTPLNVIANKWYSYDPSTPQPYYQLNFVSSGENITKMYINNQPDTFSYKISTIDNVVRNGYFFLLDPAFDMEDYFTKSLYNLPLFLNFKVTISIESSSGFNFGFYRVAANKYGYPEAIVHLNGSWHYLYENCQ